MFCSLAFYVSLNYVPYLWAFNLIEIITMDMKESNIIGRAENLISHHAEDKGRFKHNT